jgi:hypothetical protein
MQMKLVKFKTASTNNRAFFIVQFALWSYSYFLTISITFVAATSP